MIKQGIVSSALPIATRVIHATWVESQGDPSSATTCCGLDVATALGSAVAIDWPTLGSGDKVCVTCASATA